jgi:hypothetical protein
VTSRPSSGSGQRRSASLLLGLATFASRLAASDLSGAEEAA